MARHYKNKGTSLLMQDKFFYTLLTVTLILMIVAFYFAFGTNESDVVDNQDDLGINEVNNEPDESQNNSDQVLQPEISDKDVQTEAPVEDIPKDDQNTDTPQTNTPDADASGEQQEIKLTFIIPCDGAIIKDYSGSTPVFSETLQDWRTHGGIDFKTDEAANVFAAADGVVEDVYTDELMGVSILIRHGEGVYTLYQGLEENTKVLNRMEVKQGDIIGKTGLTAIEEETEGRHLHFEIIMQGKNVDPNEYIS